jgi:pimeloyl-ACP methyl ester carboxylesterase
MRLASYTMQRMVHIPARSTTLHGELTLPAGASGIVVFAGSAPSADDPSGQQYVMRALARGGLGTLVLDLAATPDEAAALRTRRHRFDVPFLAERLVCATQWLREDAALAELRVGYFASGAGSAAALAAAAGLATRVSAVVVRGGRPDFAGGHVGRITAATLLIVGGADRAMIDVVESAYDRLLCTKRMVVVPGATHRFVESGALEEVAMLAADWFQLHLEAAVRA